MNKLCVRCRINTTQPIEFVLTSPSFEVDDYRVFYNSELGAGKFRITVTVLDVAPDEYGINCGFIYIYKTQSLAICEQYRLHKGEAGVPLSVIEGAEDVDQVMVKFFDFVGGAVLVSTDALGEQKNLLCRAARYAGMKSLPNELYDLLDFAGETDCKFDFKNRTELLEMLNIAEGRDAFGKAKANVDLYHTLIHHKA